MPSATPSSNPGPSPYRMAQQHEPRKFVSSSRFNEASSSAQKFSPVTSAPRTAQSASLPPAISTKPPSATSSTPSPTASGSSSATPATTTPNSTASRPASAPPARSSARPCSPYSASQEISRSAVLEVRTSSRRYANLQTSNRTFLPSNSSITAASLSNHDSIPPMRSAIRFLAITKC